MKIRVRCFESLKTMIRPWRQAVIRRQWKTMARSIETQVVTVAIPAFLVLLVTTVLLVMPDTPDDVLRYMSDTSGWYLVGGCYVLVGWLVGGWLAGC
jgi:hypothetical protein